MARNYSNVAEETSLSSGINSSATSITVGSNTGYPSVPYTIIIDPGLATEEVCEVTAVAGTLWTITRGVDGTPAVSHDTGAVVVHGYSARDLRDIQDHISDATGVHGLGGSSSVVGTTDVQTLSNKTLSSPTLTNPSSSGGTFGSATLTTPTIASFINAQHDHADAAGGGLIGGGGGGATSGVKRSGTGTVTFVGSADATNGAAMAFNTSVYTFGAGTWTTADSDKRILIPATINGAAWHITANVRSAMDRHNAWIIIRHEDLGTLATGFSGQDATFGMDIHIMSASADFVSAAGKYIEVALGAETTGTNEPYTATVSLHRIG